MDWTLYIRRFYHQVFSKRRLDDQTKTFSFRITAKPISTFKTFRRAIFRFSHKSFICIFTHLEKLYSMWIKLLIVVAPSFLTMHTFFGGVKRGCVKWPYLGYSAGHWKMDIVWTFDPQSVLWVPLVVNGFLLEVCERLTDEVHSVVFHLSSIHLDWIIKNCLFLNISFGLLFFFKTLSNFYILIKSLSMEVQFFIFLLLKLHNVAVVNLHIKETLLGIKPHFWLSPTCTMLFYFNDGHCCGTWRASHSFFFFRWYLV